MTIPRWLFSSFSTFVLLAAAASAQTFGPAPLPKDPAALMQLAWQQNGLHGSDLKPWHVHATWQAVDANGHPSSQGTWEMWWAGEKKYRNSVATAGYQQTRYVTDQGVFVVTSGRSKPMFNPAPYLLLEPVPNWGSLTSVPLQILTHKSKGQKLICAAPKNEMGTPPLRQYCFNENLPAIRVIATSGSETIFNSFARFQGRYVARDIQIVRGNFGEFDLHVDQLEPLGKVADADFTPPAGAVTVKAPQGSVGVSSGVMAGNRVAGDIPEYPILARRNYIQGTVILKVTVEKDGTVDNLSVVNGPPELQDAALKAVRTWRYLPYLLNGQPVAVQTQVNVVFTLSRP